MDVDLKLPPRPAQTAGAHLKRSTVTRYAPLAAFSHGPAAYTFPVKGDIDGAVIFGIGLEPTLKRPVVIG